MEYTRRDGGREYYREAKSDLYDISGVDAYSIDDHELGVDYIMSKDEAVEHVQFHPELLANVM